MDYEAPVLHVVNTHTCYQNAAFITNKTAAGLWCLFVETWDTLYCAFPDVLRVDCEPSFMAAKFR